MVAFAREHAPTASIIVVGLRDAPMLNGCLESIADNVRETSYEVLVVLNDPTPRLSEEFERAVTGARIFPFRANLGFGRAVNYAASRARGEYLVLLNDDCLVQRGWLEALVATEQCRPLCGAVGSRYVNPDGTLQEAGAILWSDGTTEAVGEGRTPDFMFFERRVDYCSGGSLLVRREVWEELGGLDESYYPAYFEDVDLCLRLAESGREVWYQPHSVVSHARSASTALYFRQYLFERARETFVDKWSHALAQREPKGPQERAVWCAMGRPLRVLVIDDQLPDPSRGSGFGRMFDTLSVLEREPDLQVTFFARTPEGAPATSFPIPGVRVITDLEEHLAQEGVDFDVVVISRPHNGEIFRALISRELPNARVIYDAESLFYRRVALQASVETDPERRAALQADAARERSREHAVLRFADSVVCISEAEADEVRGVTTAPVQVVAPWLRAPRATSAGFDDRADIGMVAGWAAGPGSPNADGLRWFASEVLPKVLAVEPGSRLLVTGSDPPPDVSWLAGSAVRFVGNVRDLRAFYGRCRVIVSPTRFGAGVKLKTVEAVQYGVPVVCTEEAAAGLESRTRAAVWVAHDADEFADAVVALLADRDAWERQQSRALAAYDASSVHAVGVESWPDLIRSAHAASV